VQDPEIHSGEPVFLYTRSLPDLLDYLEVRTLDEFWNNTPEFPRECDRGAWKSEPWFWHASGNENPD